MSVRIRTSVTLGVTSSVANDAIMIIAGLVADGTGRRYGDWRHVATGCNALVFPKGYPGDLRPRGFMFGGDFLRGVYCLDYIRPLLAWTCGVNGIMFQELL